MGMCRKCGTGVMVGPRYSPVPLEAVGNMICPYPSDCLIYRCSRCGYTESTKTADEKEGQDVSTTRIDPSS